MSIPAVPVVLVTGGSRGIGAAAVRAFHARGCRVAFCYEKSAQAAAALEEELPGVRGFAADVSDPDSVRGLFAAVEQTLGAPDILVCNAGVAWQGLLTDMTDADWRRVLDVDLSGAFYCCRAALPAMIHNKWGRILLVSSMWGQVGASCEAAYSAAKAGVIGLGRALAKEVGPSGVTVNCVAPGVVETDMMAGFSAEDKAALAEETPVGRLGTPEEVARALVFLAGPDSDFITGQVLGVNGGLVI